MTQISIIIAALPMLLNYYAFHNTTMSFGTQIVSFSIVFLVSFIAGQVSGVKFIHDHVHELVDHAIEKKKEELSHSEE